MLCIKNGILINGIEETSKKKDILIDDGIIVKIEDNIDTSQVNDVIDINGKWMLPGFIDAHCHLREPGFEYKESIASGTRSAARGGFTSIAPMANTQPVVDNAALVQFIKTKAQMEGVVKVYPIGAITKGLMGEELTEMGELEEAGVVALSDDGLPVSNSNLMRMALEYAKNFNILLISHSEDKYLVNDGVMNEGFTSTILGLKGITRAAEEVMIARDLILAETTKSPIHIAHVSTTGSVELIRQAKIRGVMVTCETAPHYFSATDEFVIGYDTNAKVNPPLRAKKDVEAIKEGLRDGTIDIIATDHAPHHKDEKEVEFNLAANGISGFETAFSLCFTNLVDTGVLTIHELVNKISKKPGEIFKIKGGTLEIGKPADIAIVDLDTEYVVNVNDFSSSGKNNPFHGKTLKGKVLHTLVDGKIVVKNGINIL